MAESIEHIEEQLSKRVEKVRASFKQNTDNTIIEDQSTSFSKKKSKHVTFSEEAKQTDSVTPSRKPHYSAIRKKWFKLSLEGKYQELKQYLDDCQRKGISISDFFFREGRLILDWALTRITSSKPLQFICQNVNRDLLKEALNENEAYVVDQFVLAESSLDNMGQADNDEIEFRKEKLQLIFNLDPEIVQIVFEENSSRISNVLKNCFEMVPRSNKLY